MAWVSASSPVEAVSAGGRPSVNSGSRMATRASSRLQLTPFLVCASGSTNTAAGEISLLVPAVVGMAITGRPACGTRSVPQ